ncbi:hypothetical protein OAP32_00460 [Crocinitomicaceae bacterium]|nr:hypothetical protein [Crocinitomicaceae bacterium]
MSVQEAYRILSKSHHLTTPTERAAAKAVLDEVHGVPNDPD